MGLVHDTGSALERTIAKVEDISRIVNEIADSAKRQASGVAEIGATIDAMDKTTQENAAMADQSTAAAHSLSDDAASSKRPRRPFPARPRRASEDTPIARGVERLGPTPAAVLRTVPLPVSLRSPARGILLPGGGGRATRTSSGG